MLRTLASRLSVLSCLAGCSGAPPRPLADPSTLCPGRAPEGISGIVGAAMLTITHEQRLAGARIINLVYALDGAAVFQRLDEQGIAPPITMFHGPVPAGEHTVTFHVEVAGGGRRATLRASHAFTSAAGRSQVIAPDLEGSMDDVEHARLYVRDIDCGHPPPSAERGAPERTMTITIR